MIALDSAMTDYRQVGYILDKETGYFGDLCACVREFFINQFKSTSQLWSVQSAN
jgi:hypothetical protein